MAILRDLQSDAALPLAARLVVGRATTAALRVQDKRVSGEHATLRWTGTNWEVRDLGSRNGTFVDGNRVGSGESASLVAGSKLSFGDPAAQYVLSDAGAPGAVAREVKSGQLLGAKDGLLGLPSSEQPEVVVYRDFSGAWLAETGDERREVTDGDVIEVGGQEFSLSVPEFADQTATVESGTTLEAITLRFGVSLDEEHVQLTVISRGRRDPLEPREHGYVLLTLARKRLEDRALPSAEQGWIDRDRLLRMLQLDANGLNVAIYRARGQLASAGIDNAVGIVEVRRGQRRIGIDPDRLEVGPLE
jgi:pSer/pThr/pTyr-binding forkhead associated (FHA) protein